MKTLGNIWVTFFSIIFLLSSTGVIIFKSHCLCSDTHNVSLYVAPETCENNFHDKHEHHNDCITGCSNTNHENNDHEDHNCEDCIKHLHDCGCAEPQAKYFKLKNQFDEEARYVLSGPVVLAVFENDLTFLNQEIFDSEEQETNYIDPPPKISSSLDFLIHIQQLKIPAA